MDVGDLFRFIGGSSLRATLARLAGWDVDALTPEQAAELDRQEAEARGEPAGRALGPYVLVEKLGGGATSDVWKAWDTKLRRWVAVKEARPGSPASRERFLREARAASKVRHPHLVEALDVGDGWLAMTLVEGKPLEGIDVRGAAAALADVAGAVQALHEAGLIHRDIKPQNILLDGRGRAILADLGIVRDLGAAALTIEGTVLGTPHYMAPEQAAGQAVGAAADVYALGATLYHLAGGRPPFAGEDLPAILRKLPTEAPAALVDVPRGLAAIIARAMEKRPAERYATAAAFAEDLRRFLRGEAVQSGSTAWRALRRKLPWAAAGAVALALVVAIWIPARRSAAAVGFYHEGVELWARGDLVRAEEKFARAGDMHEALLMRGRCLLRMGRSAGALELWNRILEEDPDFAPALIERGKLRLAEAIHRRIPVSRRRSRAGIRFMPPPREELPDLTRARSKPGLDVQERGFLSGADDLLRGDEKAAMQVLGAYAESHSWDATAHSIHAAAAFLAGEYPTADAALTQAIALESQPLRFLARGDVRFAAGNAGGALDDYARAGDDERLGLALQALGRLEEAEAALDRAPRSAHQRVNRGTVRAERKNLAGAKRDFEEALELDERSADAYHNLANVNFLEEQFEDALRHYGLAIACDRGFGEASRGRGRSLLRLGQAEKAVEDFEYANAVEPTPDGFVEQASAQHLLGDRKKAANSLAYALMRAPADWPRRAEVEKLRAEWTK